MISKVSLCDWNSPSHNLRLTCFELESSVQHVALRLMCQPYLDENLWEMILRRTDWITCSRLGHVRIAKELLPSNDTGQAQLNSAVASGEIVLVSQMLQTFSGYPDMDIAAKADQFEMLRFLDGLDKGGSICLATPQMAVHAATNCNQEMLEWLVQNRLDVDGGGILVAAAAVGNMSMIQWLLQQ